MSELYELLARIDELYKRIDEEKSNFSKKKIINRKKIKRLEEEKKREGRHGHMAEVEKIKRQISQLRDETVTSNNPILEVEIKKCKMASNDIIIDYYKKNYTIEDIFRMESIPRDIQEQWFARTDFGEETGYLYVEKINNDGLYWRYYNPFTELESHFKYLKVLKSTVELQGEELVGFDDELIRESESRDLSIKERFDKKKENNARYWPDDTYISGNPIDIDAKLDELDALTFGYVTAKSILNSIADTSSILSREQVERLCEISIASSQVYNCYICSFALARILREYEDIIDDDLLKRVIVKNKLSSYF